MVYRHYDHDNEEYERTMGSFFSFVRKLANRLKEGEEYSDLEFEAIMNFITKDFHDYCHYNKETLDIDKFRGMIS